MYRNLRLTILALCMQTGLSALGTGQDPDKTFVFNHQDAVKTTKCSQCHKQSSQWLSAADSRIALWANANGTDLTFTDLRVTDVGQLRLGQNSVQGVRCGEYLVARLGDTLLRTHLRLKEREALVVLQSPAIESDSLTMEQGDVILAADGQVIGDAIKFRSKMDQNPKAKVELKLIREGKEISRTVAAIDLGSPPKVYRIGVQVEPPSDALRSQLNLSANEGLSVLEITENSPASAAGVEVHDVLLRVDQTKLSTFEDLKESINKGQGIEVELSLIRKGKPITLRAKPKADPVPEDDSVLNFREAVDLHLICPALRSHTGLEPVAKP